MAYDRANLPNFKKGQKKIPVDVLNVIVDAVKQSGVPFGEGVFEDGGGANQRSKVGLDNWAMCLSDNDIPEFSIVEIYDAAFSSTSTDPILKVKKAVASSLGTKSFYGANEDYPLVTGVYGWIRLVNPYKPVRILVTGTSPSIAFGDDVYAFGDHKVSKGTGPGAMKAVSIPGGGGGTGIYVISTGVSQNVNCRDVNFIVVSSDATTRSALGEIRGRPVGCNISDIPATTVGGTVIEVCDPAGCFFNEPNADLIGRFGWAKYMMPNTLNICSPAYIVPQWQVYSLCCTIPACTL